MDKLSELYPNELIGPVYPEYDPTYTYFLNAMINYNGITYVSLVDNNTGNTPDSSNDKWQEYTQTVQITTTKDASSADQTYTLPVISATNDGYTYRVGKTGSYALTISAYSGDDIADTTSTLTSVNRTDSFVTLMADQANGTWRIVSNSGDWKYSSRSTLPQSINGDKIYYDTTINLDNSMTTAEIQAKIDACPRDHETSQKITFQFADGTYTLSNLSFSRFRQDIYVLGNASDNTLSNTKNVVLDFIASGGNGLSLYRCGKVFIKYLAVKTDDAYGIYINSGQQLDAYFNYLYNDQQVGYLYYLASLRYGYIYSNKLRGGACGIIATGSRVYSNNNESDTVEPDYGLRSVGASVIGKSGTQPTGSTANESTSSGGVIR